MPTAEAWTRISADAAGRRLAVHARLHARNRIVSILRVGVPILGLVTLLAFVVQVFVAGLASQFGVGQIHFNGSTVAVDTPSYSGVTTNGDLYKVSAEGAETAVTDLNLINLRNATLTLTKPDASVMAARIAAGSFDTDRQLLTVPGTATVTDAAGNAGTLQNVVVDLPHQFMQALGTVSLLARDGMTVNSNGVTYDARIGLWNFGKATVTVPDAAADDTGTDDGSAGGTGETQP